MLRLISDLRFVPHADMPAKLDISTLSGNDLRMNQIKLPSAVSQDEIRVRAWAEVREALELQLAPLGQRALEALTARPGECVLDIGCGGGETALNLARAVAPNGSVLGIDLSGAMLGFARRAGNGCKRLRFVQGDAQVFPFEPASFDAAFSRFGVMFFADPALSFAHLRRALRLSGRLCFACWREPRFNPWLMLPLQAVYQHVPKLPPSAPDEPGPFAFASESRVTEILSQAGFGAINLEPCDLSLDTAIGRGLDAAVQSAIEMGPASRALEGQPAELRSAATAAIRQALTPFAVADTVSLGASIWIVTATAS